MKNGNVIAERDKRSEALRGHLRASSDALLPVYVFSPMKLCNLTQAAHPPNPLPPHMQTAYRHWGMREFPRT